MPSSSKTPFLKLNKWLGLDKPKKDDFNSDNQKIDEAYGLLSQSVVQLEAAQQSSSYASEQAVEELADTVASHSSDANVHASSSEKTAWNTAATMTTTTTNHIENTNVHVTSSEKIAWNGAASFVLGSYIGNGATTQKITLGYQPKFIFIFPVGDGLIRANWLNEMLSSNSGCLTPLGSTFGMTLNADGFTVEYYSPGGVDGFQIKNNAPGVKYVYLIWK